MAGEVALDKLLKQTPMQAISMKSRLINQRFFVYAHRVTEHIDRTDQNEGFALDGFQVRD
jgi:hypothetical protein